MKLDLNTEFGQRVQRRLFQEAVIWLTTVDPDGSPQPRPVWFLWDGEAVLIYSQPGAHKLRHIEKNPQVALNFNSDEEGGDVVVILGHAEIQKPSTPANQVSAYLEKYRGGIAGIEMTPESFSQEYSIAIRVKPERLRGF